MTVYPTTVLPAGNVQLKVNGDHLRPGNRDGNARRRTPVTLCQSPKPPVLISKFSKTQVLLSPSFTK